MARFTKIKEFKHSLSCGGYLFEFDTAYELGNLMARAFNKIENPYDPSCTDYDDFNNAVWDVRDEKRKRLSNK